MFLLEQSGRQDTIHPFDLRDRGLLLAHGVFDTSLVVCGTVTLRSAHVNRLVRDAAALGIAIDHKKINDLLDNNLTEDHSGVLRITVTSGPAERWSLNTQMIPPTVLLSLSPPNKGDQFKSISLQTSLIRRNSTSPTSRHKTLAYTDNLAALKAARDEGYDDALFLNTFGNVCCTTIGNLFLKLGNTWATPLVSDGVLPGVMRKWMMQIAPEIDLEVVERTIAEDELQFVEAAFMTNSARLAAPISKINKRKLPPKLPGGLKSVAMELIRKS
ncbi:MAG: class IV aminotransferase [Rhodothermaceae bacterium]|nr:class IV aminotransferase [Rhodothermaceae bacterium]